MEPTKVRPVIEAGRGARKRSVGCSAIVGQVSLEVITLLRYKLESDYAGSGCFYVNVKLSQQVMENVVNVYIILGDVCALWILRVCVCSFVDLRFSGVLNMSCYLGMAGCVHVCLRAHVVSQ